jgi:nicotinamidase-related amidase
MKLNNKNNNKSINQYKDNFGVVVIDMQEEFIKHLTKEEREDLIKSQVDFLNYCCKKNYPIFFIEYVGSKKTIKEIDDVKKQFQNWYVFKKTDNGGFKNKKFEKQIDDLGLEYLCFMGGNAIACMRDTIEPAMKRNKKIILAKNLVYVQENPNKKEVDSFYDLIKEKGTYAEHHKDLKKILD